MAQKYFIKTFGCQQNVADSERIASFYESRGFDPARNEEEADTIVINTCVVRERAAEKVYGLVKNLEPLREKKPDLSIVITGCLIGAASREPSGKMMKALRKRVLASPSGGTHVQLLPLEEVGFEHTPKRTAGKLASIPISNGCNNYCTYCIVPFSRGKERSRPFAEIVAEAEEAVRNGYEEIMLLGQNVNSYGADFLVGKIKDREPYELPDGTKVEPIMVKHLNRHRIPTLFPHLLERVATIPGVTKLSFISSNPWDFSDELIDVIARHENIDRLLHLPVQAGSDEVLKNMNRWYTREEYMALVDRIRAKVPGVRFTTDIIVGFPGETKEQFGQTMDLARRVGFEKAFIAWYSPRPGTAAAKMKDDVPFPEKKRRFKELDDLVFRKIGMDA
jgi:tRNA-2-methylthio-N6-dimethylallyladenosine synthase